MCPWGFKSGPFPVDYVALYVLYMKYIKKKQGAIEFPVKYHTCICDIYVYVFMQTLKTLSTPTIKVH